MKAELKGLTKEYFGNKYVVTFETEELSIVSTFERLKGKDANIEIKEYRAKRSLDANAYYWVLIGKLAPKLKLPNAVLHNLMLRRYGQLAMLDGRPVWMVVPDSEDAEDKALESETFHIKPTSQVKEGVDGRMYRTYQLLRGSHEYDTAEMSILINGLVDECKAYKIETATPAELEEMLRLWESHRS